MDQWKMLIEVENLSKVYTMGSVEVHALRGVSFSIGKQEFVSIMGPSGSGKSTLMDILGCLAKPSSGTYLLEGMEVANMSDNRLAGIRNKSIGFVFQAFNLLPRTTALHNVELPLIYSGMGRRERRRRARAALEAVGLADRMHHKSNELSGGQIQRVGNLDTSSGAEVMEIFDRLNQEGNTIIMVTHERYIAEHANRIIHLKDGVIEQDEKVE
jgi:putative ABC transport system ATP-binding protein